MKRLASRLLLAALWLLHFLPLSVLALLGRGLGRLLHRFGHARRRVALRNVQRCLPELSLPQREALVREHFEWLGRSLLERGVLWWASEARLRRLIQVRGDVGLAQNSSRPVMWLVPHFLGMDVAGMASQLFQSKPVCAIYQRQSNGVFEQAMLKGRSRFGQGEIHTRHDSALRLVRAIRRGRVFFNLPDMDFGLKDSAFVPFFGHPAATLLAPARLARSLDMVVQPVLTEILPGGQGYRVSFLEPWDGFDARSPADDEIQAAGRMNAWIEARVREKPQQYLWVHKRFKTRPQGQAPFYG